MSERLEVLESEQKFRRLMDSAPVFIWEAGPDGRCTFFNKAWLEFTGRSLDEEIQGDWAESIHPDDYERCLQSYLSAFEEKKDFRLEYRLLRHDGVYRWILDIGTVKLDSELGFNGYIGSCVDITEHRQLAEEKERLLLNEKNAREELEKLNRIKDEFLTTISHELRTPLNSLIGWSDLLRNGELDSRELEKEAFEIIYRNSIAQNQVISDLLDVSKIIQGKMSIDSQSVDILPVTKRALDAIQLSAKAKRIEINFCYDAYIGPIVGDPERIQQAIWNILSNAVKFTDSGGRICIFVKRVGNEVVVCVTDSGEGVDPEFLPFVFERFRQEDGGLKRKYTGLGLGLSIVKHLVELHGGKVDIESPGKGLGTSIRVILPLAAVRLPTGEQSNLNRDDIVLDKILLGLRILVLDDQPDVLNLIRIVLRKSGAHVITANSVHAALQVLNSNTVDLILSDLEMPHADGYDFIRAIKSQGIEARVIALTAHAKEEDRIRALGAGFLEHLSKPVDTFHLVRTLAKIAGRTLAQ